ncbi:hypothetical protein B0J13DRAFT_648138 [Dactylonectria estremocensis]|uniref:Rhodopsin domain-containing protein n=1 Tax=Dactylonectria estremocensis TaxID=1079267 RepID=A0A9P9IJS2_9HYPO|nr:hypothetical protein B0J13DRAFT_648138 [Dactylonectria estremocensis]
MSRVLAEGVPLLYVTILMLALSWVTVVARLGVRRWKKNLGLDDWLMCAGLILYTVTAALVIVCCFYGAGQRSEALDPADVMKGVKLFFIAEFFYAACTVPIKASICVTLLRIADSRRRFVWTIWGIIILMAIAAVVFILVIANICHPITALWGETAGVCNLKLNSSVSFFFSAVSIVTDWTLAILPGVLLWKVQMKSRVKLSVAVMLGLAAFASCATIVRLRFLTLYNDPNEFMYSTGAIGLWSILEEGIGIVAGSMPALRPLLSLPMFGRSTYASGSGSGHPSAHIKSSASGNTQVHSNTRHPYGDTVKMATLSSSITANPGYHQKDRSRGSIDDDGDSQKYILKQTQVTSVAEYSAAADDWRRQQELGVANNKY